MSDEEPRGRDEPSRAESVDEFESSGVDEETWVYSDAEGWHLEASSTSAISLDEGDETPSPDETRPPNEQPPSDEERGRAPRPVESMRNDDPETPMLVKLAGRRAGETHLLEADRVTIGRARGRVDISFADRAVSRIHACLERRSDGSYRIRDLDSANGTYVNRQRVNGTRRLREGDKIVFSKHAILMYTVPDSLERDFHRRMYESSVRDAMTGANSRAYLEEQLRSELALFSRHGRDEQSALFLLDLDHFSEVNDRHGHFIGDAVLVAFADLCKTLIRREDVFARYGGEEFGLLLRRADEEHVREISERIRRRVEISTFRVEDRSIDLTVSIGGAISPDDSVKRWLQRADRALYRAKSDGRNRVRIEDLD